MSSATETAIPNDGGNNSGRRVRRLGVPHTKTLRRYQAQRVRLAVRHIESGRDVLIESPTGSGKTLMMRSAVRLLMGGPISHAIVATPQEAIEDGFVEDRDCRVEWPESEKRRGIDVPRSSFRKARGSAERMARTILDYLQSDQPGYALVCTHAALNRFVAAHGDEMPGDMAGCLLTLDEAHHAPAPALSRSVDAWSDRGCRLLFASATPYRADGLKVVRPNMEVIRLGMAEHMHGGFAPSVLEHAIVAVGNDGDRVTAGEFTGSKLSTQDNILDDIIAKSVEKWIILGRPKLVFRVPIMAGGSTPFLLRLIDAFERQGARVLNAAGTDKADQLRTLAALKAERDRSVAESQFDVVIGIQRVIEGFDWPHCSVAFCVGIPGNLAAVVQLLGRATRLKPEGYPEPWQDKAGIWFFVPTAGGKALDKLGAEHSRHALMVSVYLADYEVGEEWIVTRAIRAGLEGAGLGGEKDGDGKPREIVDARHGLDESTYIEVKAAMAADAEGNEHVSLGGLIEAARRRFPDVPGEALDVIAVQVLGGDERIGPEAMARLAEEMGRLAVVKPDIDRAKAAAFAAIVKEYRDAELGPVKSFRVIGEQVHEMTGQGMKTWISRIRHEPWNVNSIVRYCNEWKEMTGKFPSCTYGEIPRSGGRTWRGANDWLMSQGSSLAKLIASHFFDGAMRVGWDESQILRYVADHLEANGTLPHQRSGLISGSNGKRWDALHAHLTRNGSSLEKFLRIHYPDRYPEYFSEEFIAKSISTYHGETGKYPSQGSGEIIGSNGRTWLGAHAWLYLRGDSLSRFIDRNFRHRKPFSAELVEEFARDWFQRTGEWPKAHSGLIPNSGELTWSAVEKRLYALTGLGISKFLDNRFPKSITHWSRIRGKKTKPTT